MKKAKILSTLMALFIVSTQTMGVIPDITFKNKNRQLTAYAYTENVSGKWIQDEKTKKWWYKHDDGSYTKYNWEKIDNEWYFFDESGWMQTGWKNIKNIWYYFNSNGSMHKGWLKDDKGDYYYLSPESGAMRTGWLNYNGFYYYFDSNGVMQKGWKVIEGKDYYFNPESGAMRTGWYNYNGIYYYFDSNGVMQRNWKEIAGKWYYFNLDGVMLKGWLTLNNQTYYLDKKNGDMKTGWNQINNTWYYFNPSGSMYKGWLKDDKGDYYYLSPESGAMRTGWLKDDKGDYYYLSPDSGVMRTGWVQDKGNWYYLNKIDDYGYLTDENKEVGALLTGRQIIDSETYYFNKNDDDKGKMLTGWQVIDGKEYYFQPSGVMQRYDTKIDYEWFYFDLDGVRLYPTVYERSLIYTITGINGLSIYSDRIAVNNALTTVPMYRDCYVKMVIGDIGYVSKIRGNDGNFYEGWVFMDNLTRGWPCKTLCKCSIRQSAGSMSDSNTILGYIPEGEIVVVKDSYQCDDSMWVKVEYNGVIGWTCFLNENTTYCVGVSDFGSGF